MFIDPIDSNRCMVADDPRRCDGLRVRRDGRLWVVENPDAGNDQSPRMISHTGTFHMQPSAWPYFSDGQQTPETILGALLREWWDVRYGYTLISGKMESLTGQKLGLVLSAATPGDGPPLTVDGTNFKGQPAIVCAGAAFPSLKNSNFGLNLHAAGARPYGATVCRFTNTPSSMVQHIPAGTCGRVERETGSAKSRLNDVSGIAIAAIDQNPHFIEWGFTALGEGFISIDGSADVLAGTGLSTPSAIIGVSIMNDLIRYAGNAWFAFHATATSIPTTGQRADMVSWSRSNWGTP